MRSGIITDRYSATATFAAVTGTYDANYPVTNLSDIIEPNLPARVAPATNAATFTAVLAASQTVQAVALVGHKITAGGKVQVLFYSDAAMTTQVDDSGLITIPTPVSGLPQTFPVVLAAALTVRAIRVELTVLSGDLDIGACAIGDWWEWPKITAGMDAGLKPSGSEVGLVGGASIGSSATLLRTRSGQVSYMDLATSSTTGLDFQKRQALAKPFVFVEDYSDSTTWPRDCFLARNDAIPPMVAVLFDRDTFQFRFVEHRR